MIVDLTTSLPQVKAGKLKALGVSSPKRSPLAPELPTIAEAGRTLGLGNFDVSTWFGLFGPAGLPADTTAKLNKAFVDALKLPEVKARMAQLMSEPAPMTPPQFGAFVKGELARYEKVVKASGAKVD
jgi:tripartite-type tricarboxylate transporter receptor subunit TctC